jgi:signal transduction histidine kinase
MTDPRDDGSRYLRTELLERIAHELRGPAGVTLGALDELEHGLGVALVEQHRLLFAMARRGAKRVLRTAERLTRTAQLESSSAQVVRVQSDLRGVVQQAVKDAVLIEARSSVALNVLLPEDPCLCDIDSGWLTVAVSELVSQAVRSARRQVEVSVHAEEHGTVLRVSDDRTVIMDSPAVRFVPLQDRRDAALGWPLICDVARAHEADLSTEPQHDSAGAVTGFVVSLRLPCSA